MEKKRAAIYNRCSTQTEQQEAALSVQAEESREIVKEKGWQLVAQYIETESGTGTRKRTQYLRMIEDIKEHRFDILVIKSLDRINRNVRDFYILLDILVRNEIELYIYLDGRFFEFEDSLIIGIKAILAEDFSRELSKKIRNSHARRQSRKSGYNITRPMFGWDKVAKDVYVINEQEAAAYREAFALALSGDGYRVIARKMREKGIKSRTGGDISENQWRKMLRSPRAHGEVVLHQYSYDFNRKKKIKLPPEEWIHIKNALPPIIPEEEHKKVLAILDARAACVNEYGQFRRKKSKE